MYLLYFKSLLAGYRVADRMVVYPLARGRGPLITAAVAVTKLHETLTVAGAAGVLAACGGVFLIAGGTRLFVAVQPTSASADAHRRVRAGVRWGLATGACIAGYTVIDGYAVKVLLMGPVVDDYLCNVLRVPL